MSVEARELEEQVRRLEREDNEARERERELRNELEALRERTNASLALEDEVDAWTTKAEEAEARMRSQWHRLHTCIGECPPDILSSYNRVHTRACLLNLATLQ